MRSLPAWLAGLALVVAQPAAALMVEVSNQELASSADAVVRGKVTKLESRYQDAVARFIVTDVTLHVSEVWSGGITAGRDVVFTVVGGKIGDLGMRQSNQPSFSTDEDVVLFLRNVPNRGYEVNYLEQGKFTIEDGRAWSYRGTPISLTALKLTVSQYHKR
jgi:hypothetical protein